MLYNSTSSQPREIWQIKPQLTIAWMGQRTHYCGHKMLYILIRDGATTKSIMPTPLFSNILIVSQGSFAITMPQLRITLWGSCAPSEITHIRYPPSEMKPACLLLLITKFNSPHLNRSLRNFGYYLHKWRINTLWQWHVYCAQHHLNKLEPKCLPLKQSGSSGVKR